MYAQPYTVSMSSSALWWQGIINYAGIWRVRVVPLSACLEHFVFPDLHIQCDIYITLTLGESLKWHCTYPNGYILQAKFISLLSRYKVCNTGIQVYAVGIFSLLHDTKLQQELRSYYNSEHTCARTHTYVPYLVILWIIFYHFFNILQFWNQVFVQVFQDLPPEIRRNFT